MRRCSVELNAIPYAQLLQQGQQDTAVFAGLNATVKSVALSLEGGEITAGL